MIATACLLLGSNLGDRAQYLEMAQRLIETYCGNIIAVSSIYETTPWGFIAENQFLNQAIMLRTPHSPENLLARLQGIEAEMGRTRKSDTYESRTIDIDILLIEKIILNTKQLILPHPRLHLRRFALIPLMEIAPQMIHPVFKLMITELNALCEDTLQVYPYQQGANE